MVKTESQSVILAYNGVDGFCAAAAALLHEPESRLGLTGNNYAQALKRLGAAVNTPRKYAGND